jgi:hypothetical protein
MDHDRVYTECSLPTSYNYTYTAYDACFTGDLEVTQKQPSVVFLYTSGKADHRWTFKLPPIAFFLVNDLDMVVACGTCLCNSYASNPSHRVH